VGRGRSDGGVELRPLPHVEIARDGVRVEAELAGCPMNEAAREDTVERRSGSERALEKCFVSGRLLRTDERLRPPRRTQDRGVDARRRREARPWHPTDEAQLVPRSPGAAEHGRWPDGCPLRCEPPLHDRVKLRERHARIAEQTTKDRGARGERQVRDDRERLDGERQQRRVARQHLDVRIRAEASLELPQRYRVELDRAHSGARIDEGTRQRTAAGAEVERERSRPDSGIPDELVGEGATTKCVAATRPRLR
jgi:hypothetical protein